jgi:predicted nucleotidyltransferase
MGGDVFPCLGTVYERPSEISSQCRRRRLLASNCLSLFLYMRNMNDIIRNMNVTRPELLPIFRSRHQLELLGHLFLNVGRPTSIADISRKTRIPQPSVSREVERLRRAGVIQAQQVGRTKLVEIDAENPFFTELQALILKAVGPSTTLRRYLLKVDNVDRAYIFGSWARRYLGEPGRYPEDVDVLVIGDPDPDEVDDVCRRAQRKLGLQVNPMIALPRQWAAPDSGFLQQVKAGPLLELFDRSVDGKPV